MPEEGAILRYKTVLRAGGLLFGCSVLMGSSVARAEPASCASGDPNDWPQPSKPYILLAVDTSGSMTACTTPATAYPKECDTAANGYKVNSCGLVPNRMNDAKCALRQTIQAFSGQVHFGLATFAMTSKNCPMN